MQPNKTARSYGVMVSTLDSESSDPSSNLGRTYIFIFLKWGRKTVADGFDALESMPEWYQYTLGVIVAASFGVRSATKFFGGKK